MYYYDCAAHASIVGIKEFIPHRYAGFLMVKEMRFLIKTFNNPTRPFAALIGGAKVSSKISVLYSLLTKVDKLFIGGAMVFTFYYAMGMVDLGDSLVEYKFATVAGDILKKAKENKVLIYLAKDALVMPTKAYSAMNEAAVTDIRSLTSRGIESGWMGVDIGPETIGLFKKELLDCATILWNGISLCYIISPCNTECNTYTHLTRAYAT